MCLKAHEGKKIAEEDIVVYKIICKNTDVRNGKFMYEPPFEYGHFLYKKGINSTATELEGIYQHCDDIDGPYTEVNFGFLHAFTNLDRAIFKMNVHFDNYGAGNRFYTYHVFKMVIPKGTEYFEGNDSDICSKELLWKDMTPVISLE